MDIIKKDASIENTDDGGPGSFQVILSAPTKDRDGDTLLPGDWKQPLPDHITFDMDHGMTVASTVGSGVPRLDPDSGNLIVDGTYSSLPRAQEVRTLVREGHIKTTSVAFMSEPATEKDGTKRAVRELLNGAFVAIPSNREALVLASKSGARNSKSDAQMIQQIHDHSVALGAKPADKTDDGKSINVGTVTVDVKTSLGLVDRSKLPEPARKALDALLAALPEPDEEIESKSADEAAAGSPAAEDSADEADKFRLAAHVRAMTTLALNSQPWKG